MTKSTFFDKFASESRFRAANFGMDLVSSLPEPRPPGFKSSGRF